MKDYTPKHDFNPMDCTDIVIGTARGETSRIWDYYTRDRSTPRLDNFWGGKSELSATAGFEKDGVTTIIFRKKLEAEEPSDHSITDDLMHIIWAKGQVSKQSAEKWFHTHSLCLLGAREVCSLPAVWFRKRTSIQSRILSSG